MFYPAPKITYDNVLRQALSLKLGQTIYIEVNVSGFPKPAVSWFHGDKKLELGDSRAVVEVYILHLSCKSFVPFSKPILSPLNIPCFLG